MTSSPSDGVDQGQVAVKVPPLEGVLPVACPQAPAGIEHMGFSHYDVVLDENQHLYYADDHLPMAFGSQPHGAGVSDEDEMKQMMSVMSLSSQIGGGIGGAGPGWVDVQGMRTGQDFAVGPSPDGRSMAMDGYHVPMDGLPIDGHQHGTMDGSGMPMDGQALPCEYMNTDGSKGDAGANGIRSVESDEDLFAMYLFKVVHCSKQFVHDWKECPYAHEGETARRRHPSQHTAQPCPDFKSAKLCPRGDKCQMAHGPWEAGLHPDAFRTNLCAYGRSCQRRMCFFAHDVPELRTPQPGMVPHIMPPAHLAAKGGQWAVNPMNLSFGGPAAQLMANKKAGGMRNCTNGQRQMPGDVMGMGMGMQLPGMQGQGRGSVVGNHSRNGTLNGNINGTLQDMFAQGMQGFQQGGMMSMAGQQQQQQQLQQFAQNQRSPMQVKYQQQQQRGRAMLPQNQLQQQSQLHKQFQQLQQNGPQQLNGAPPQLQQNGSPPQLKNQSLLHQQQQQQLMQQGALPQQNGQNGGSFNARRPMQGLASFNAARQHGSTPAMAQPGGKRHMVNGNGNPMAAGGVHPPTEWVKSEDTSWVDKLLDSPL